MNLRYSFGGVTVGGRLFTSIHLVMGRYSSVVLDSDFLSVGYRVRFQLGPFIHREGVADNLLRALLSLCSFRIDSVKGMGKDAAKNSMV